jgi:hypothetical protein
MIDICCCCSLRGLGGLAVRRRRVRGLGWPVVRLAVTRGATSRGLTGCLPRVRRKDGLVRVRRCWRMERVKGASRG